MIPLCWPLITLDCPPHQVLAQEAKLARLLEQCGEAKASLASLVDEGRRKRQELGSMEVALADLRLELQQADGQRLAQLAELQAQSRQMQADALAAATARAATRSDAANAVADAKRLHAANALARVELDATRRVLESLQQETANFTAEAKTRFEHSSEQLERTTRPALADVKARLLSVRARLEEEAKRMHALQQAGWTSPRVQVSPMVATSSATALAIKNLLAERQLLSR